MDPADSPAVRSAFRTHEEHIRRHEEQLALVRKEVKDMSDRHSTLLTAFDGQINQLINQVRGLQHSPAQVQSQSAPPAATSPSMSSQSPAMGDLARPEKFSGDSGDCRSFLTQCEIHFEMRTAAFSSERSKIAFILSHLSGRAEAWATAEWAQRTRVCDSLAEFTGSLTRIFQHNAPGREAARALVSLRQGKRRVSDFAIEFRTLAADSGWNQSALIDAFLHGLVSSMKDHLAPLDIPDDLDSLISLAIKIDKRLAEREKERSRSGFATPGFSKFRSESDDFRGPSPSSCAPSPPSGPEEPMQLGRTRLPSKERQHRSREGCCFYCGKSGHLLSSCPVKDQAHQ